MCFHEKKTAQLELLFYTAYFDPIFFCMNYRNDTHDVQNSYGKRENPIWRAQSTKNVLKFAYILNKKFLLFSRNFLLLRFFSSSDFIILYDREEEDSSIFEIRPRENPTRKPTADDALSKRDICDREKNSSNSVVSDKTLL